MSHFNYVCNTNSKKSFFALYGEINVSTIKTKPKDRKEVLTSIINSSKINDLLQKLKGRLKKRAGFLDTPIIGEEENDDENEAQFLDSNIYLMYLKIK